MNDLDYRALLDVIDHGFCIIQVQFDTHGHPLDFRFLEVNATFEAKTGLVGAVGRTMRSLRPDHESHWFEAFGEIARTGKPLRFERVASALGRWFDGYAFRVGEPAEHRVAILFNDVTQRRRDEDRLVLLNREISHRAKNLLAVVSSIARLTDADTVAAYKKALLGRIDALAISQTLLSEACTEAADIARLMAAELAAFQPAGSSRIALHGPPIMLDHAAIQALAMAVHELATNATKHGALSTDEGRVSVDWTQDDDGQVRVRWAETGGPVVEKPGRHGLGIGTIMSCSHDELGRSQVRFDWRPEGLVCELALPPRTRKAGAGGTTVRT
jgi:two-component sensor histidine kinase